MTPAIAKTNATLDTQEHCIDLPGESVKCWVGPDKTKLSVVLRKHRDIVFDIGLKNGKSYTVEATESDFYDAIANKCIYTARHEKVTFKDGERMHVWVSRGFRGSLLLKCEGKVLAKVEPNEWDKHQHGNDPKEKPAPIIITMAAPPTPPKPAPVSLNKDEQSLHVHEISKEHAPNAVLKFFADGGESLNLDTENIITRNWVTSQLAGAAGYYADNHTWINELWKRTFRIQKVVHKSGIKYYMIFSGCNKTREIMSASRYGFLHSKIMRITGGAGGMKQAWDTTKGAVKDAVKVFAKEEGKMVVKGGGVAVVFTIAMDVAEWHKDYSEIGPDGKPKKDLSDLFAKIGTDLVKAGIVAALTTATMALTFGALAAAGVVVAAPVVAVVLGTIAVSILWCFAIEKIDKAIGRAVGAPDTTSWLSKKFSSVAEYLKKVTKDARYEAYPSAIMF
jgi:hypothetical protein